MALFDFLKPKWQRSNPVSRRDGVRELRDEAILVGLAENDPDSSVRKSAVIRLDMIRPRWQHSQAERRKEAVEELDDEATLDQLAKNDVDQSVREAALHRLDEVRSKEQTLNNPQSVDAGTLGNTQASMTRASVAKVTKTGGRLSLKRHWTKRTAIKVGIAVLVVVVAWVGWSRFGSKSWWVYGANVEEMGTGYMFALGIASRNNSFIKSLENEKWEIKPGPECSETALVVTFPLFVNSHPDECSYPHRTIKVAVAPKGGTLSLANALESAIRVKGETTWVKLSDIITVGEDGRSYKVR